MSNNPPKPTTSNDDELSKIDALIAQHADVFEGVPQLGYSRAVKYGDDLKKSQASAGPSVPQGGYRCHKCGESGHFIQDCPMNSDEGRLGKVRQARGIPKTFLETVTEAEAVKRGAFISAEGELVAMKSASMEERLRLVGPSVDVDLQRIFGKAWQSMKATLNCFLCGNIVNVPVITPCCGELFCRQCILSHLDRTVVDLDASVESRECPNCDRHGLVAADLLPDTKIGEIVGRSLSRPENGGRQPYMSGPHAPAAKRVKVNENVTNLQVDIGGSLMAGVDRPRDGVLVRRHPDTVLVPGGHKNPFFAHGAPLLSESDFIQWQTRFRKALRDTGFAA